MPHPVNIIYLLANKTSLNLNTPRLPGSHCAAFSAPRANPSRLRAVCRSVMVSAAESKPISCVPGMRARAVGAGIDGAR